MSQDKNTSIEPTNIETKELSDNSTVAPMSETMNETSADLVDVVASEAPTDPIEEPTNAKDSEKKGIWSRILHSKDSTKLVASVAFCAVFATCTLLSVTVLDNANHLKDRAPDVRMEQRAEFDRGADDKKDFDYRSSGKDSDHRLNDRDAMGDSDMRGKDRNGSAPDVTEDSDLRGKGSKDGMTDSKNVQDDNAKSSNPGKKTTDPAI